MPSDQIRAEMTIVYRDQLPDDLARKMAEFFAAEGADAVQCAAKTSIAGMSNFMKLAVFARDRDDLMFLYFKEDVHTLKVHLESTRATALDSLNHDREQFEKQVVVEIGRMERLSKMLKYKVENIDVAVSLNDSEISTAEQKRFVKRLSDGLKSASLAAKAGGIVATGVAGYLLQMDSASAAKGMLAGLVAIAVTTVAEAALSDPFEFHRR